MTTQTKTLGLAGYWKTNKRRIIRNWRKNEFIREKHQFSALRYIQHIITHIDNQNLNCDLPIGTIEQELYKKL